MANRYWVGGAGSWNATTTTNWSTSSGGAGGASVPTASDNVFFDANSNVGTGAFTVTMAISPRVCNDFTASGLDGAMTLLGTGIGLTVSGSLTFQATNFSATYTGTTTFNATTTGKTITTNGVAFGGLVTFDGVGGGWTLGSALNTGGNTLTVTNGTFDTSSVNNYSVTASAISSSNSNARTINLNASTVTVSGVSPITFTTSTNLTFNAGTSQINATTSIATINTGSGFSFYNVSLTNTGLTSASFIGPNTFNNLTFTGRTTVGISVISLSSNQTINGTFTVSAGTASAYRIFLASGTFNTIRTLTCAAVSLTDTDFRDITIAGAAAPATGTRLGDCKGNSGITFGAAKTVYFGQTTASNWGATGSGSWSATSGGALDATQFPLAQDTAIFPAATYPASGSSISMNASYNLGTVDLSLRTTNTMTLGFLSCFIHGNLIFGTGSSGTGTTLTLTFAGRITQLYSPASNSREVNGNIVINSPGGTVQLQAGWGPSSNMALTLTLTAGTLDLQSYTLRVPTFTSSNTNTRSIAFGTGNILCTGSSGTVWDTGVSTNLTTTGTQVVNVALLGTSAATVSTGTLSEANSISFNITSGTNNPLTFLGTAGYTARNVDFTGFAGTLGATSTATIYGNLTISSGMTLTASTSAMTFGATSGTQQITTNAKTLDFPLTFNGVGGTFQLQSALTMGSTRTATLTNGTLDLQSYTLSTGLFSSTNSNTRTIAFGTGNITCTSTGTVWNTGTGTGLTTTGTQVVNVTSAGSTAITVLSGILSEANSISYNFTGGTYALTFLGTATYTARNVNFTGYAGTWGATSTATIYGNLTISTGMTLTSSANTLTFGATSGTKTITSNAKTLNFPITFNGVGGTFQLQSALTMGSTRTATLTNGTLDLQSYTLTTGSFSSDNSNTRTIAFGTGQISLPSTGTVWDTPTVAGLTTTGTQVVNVTSTGSTGITVNLGFMSEANSISFNFTGGTYPLNFIFNYESVRNLNFTGYSGTWTFYSPSVYGNLTLSAGMTFIATFGISLEGSGLQQITTNGQTINFNLYFSGYSTTSFNLLDNLTYGSALTTYLFGGQLNLNGQTLTASNSFIAYGIEPIELLFNGGTLVCPGASTTAFQNLVGSSFITTAGTGTGTISMTAATAKTFDGDSATYNCTLNQGGAGALTIKGSNTFNNITNTVQPATILFPSGGATTTFSNFSLSGTSGNLITIGSKTSGMQAILSKSSGTVSVSYCSITDSYASGGATWNAANSTDGGNNFGWIFGGVIYDVFITEGASGIDSIVGYANFYSAVQEAASGLDQISSAQTFATTVSETGSGIDSISAAQRFTSSISETGSGVDQTSASFTASSNISEAASGIDAVSSFAVFPTSVSEAASGIDATSSTQTFATSVTETSAGLDRVDSSQTFATAVAETGSGVDQVDASAVFNSSASETASGVDSVSSNPLFSSSISETASGIDAVSSKQSFASDIAETAAGLDAISAAQSFATSVTETASGVDQVDSAQAFRSLIAETASGVDSDSVAASTFNAYASETSSGVDSISSKSSFGSSVNETGAGIDAISSKQTFATAVDEAGSGVDTTLAAQRFATAIIESASGVDSVSSNSTFGSSISEAASGVDSIFSSATFASSIAETASGVDSIYSYQGFAALISEAASGLDAISTAGSIFNAIFTDFASGIDALQPNFTYNIIVPEGVSAQDFINSRYLWELIDNTETSDWGVINDTQTASWSQIDDTQALNWQNVGNTQTATWSQIDDTESGNWEQI